MLLVDGVEEIDFFYSLNKQKNGIFLMLTWLHQCPIMT